MGTLTLKNRAHTANFEYAEDTYSLTGNVRTDDTDAIVAIEGGVVYKDNTVCGTFYAFPEGDGLKINLNSVESSELGTIGVIINDCISSLKENK